MTLDTYVNKTKFSQKTVLWGHSKAADTTKFKLRSFYT